MFLAQMPKYLYVHLVNAKNICSMVSKDHSTDGSGSQTCQLQNLTIFWTGVDFFYFRDRVNNVFTEPVRNYISPMMFTDPKSEMTPPL